MFAEQETLEKIHRQEEDELYRQMFEERQAHIDKLDQLLQMERDKTVRELVTWFERKEATDEAREAGLARVRHC